MLHDEGIFIHIYRVIANENDAECPDARIVLWVDTVDIHPKLEKKLSLHRHPRTIGRD